MNRPLTILTINACLVTRDVSNAPVPTTTSALHAMLVGTFKLLWLQPVFRLVEPVNILMMLTIPVVYVPLFAQHDMGRQLTV